MQRHYSSWQSLIFLLEKQESPSRLANRQLRKKGRSHDRNLSLQDQLAKLVGGFWNSEAIVLEEPYPGVVVHTVNLALSEAEAGGLRVPGQSRLRNETLSQRENNRGTQA